MDFTVGLLVQAGLIGLIIVIMERGHFPGWGPMLGVVLAMGLTRGVLSLLLPQLWPLWVVAGAAVGAYVISWLCDMPLQRAAVAVAICVGASVVLELAALGLMGA